MKDRRKKRWPLLLIGGLAFVLLLAIAYWLTSPRELTATEENCVGSWCFPSADNPSTLIVYHFLADGRAVEEHYYLTSATPTVPRLTMHGVWRIEKDGRLLVEPSKGIAGVITEASRQIRTLRGDQRSDHPLHRRIYKFVSADDSGLKVLASRRVDSGEYEELVMEEFRGVR
jgi:hypothetical protein